MARWRDLGFGDLERHYSTLTDLRREMDRIFSDFERDWSPIGNGRGGVSSPARAPWPRPSVHDAGSAIKLRAEVPGLSEKELNITLEQNTLTLSGERSVDAPEGFSVHRQERAPFRFSRSFMLPCRVDANNVNAQLKHGILELTLPKVPEEQPRQIQVKAS